MNDNAKETPKSASLGLLCKDFVQSVEGLAESLPFVMTVLGQAESIWNDKLNGFIEENATNIEKTETGRSYSIKIQDKSKHDKLHRHLRIFRQSRNITPRSFLVALVSAYDAFLGRIISQLFYLKPELLNSSERTLTFSQLVNLQTVDAAREHLVEKEVESVLRKSHSQQFEWLEKTFSVPLRKGLDCWPRFIELTERRNLFVHADGIISSQYLTVCKEQSVKIEANSILGTQLLVDHAYFEQASYCLMEIGIKLAHVLWRKLAPEDRKIADSNLVELIFDLLVKHKYHVASDLAEFGTDTLKTHSSEEYRRIIVINRALAYKFGGQPDKADSVLNAEDWSSSSDKFRIAVEVLRDHFQEASSLMRLIGNNREPGKFEYREWPLFKEFRKSSEFAEAYKEVFGEEFTLQEQSPLQSDTENKDKDTKDIASEAT